jgi:hypothetical protein
LSSLSQQFSGIASLAGISLPGGSSTAEVTSLLNSTVVREKVITENNLLPVIFADKWDNEKKEWKKPNMFLMALYRFKSFLKSSRPGESKISVGDPWVPTTWDGLRELGDDGDIITVTSDDKAGTVSITARMDDPEMAAKLVSYFITTLTDHMSGEARRVAETNRRYLEGQLSKAADPAIRQKIYALMSQHVETLLMAEVKENYAFKVLDPPKAPDEKIKPKRGRMVVLSFMLALFLGVVAALVLEFLEKQKELINVDAAALKEQKPEPLTIFEAERNKTQRSREMYQE